LIPNKLTSTLKEAGAFPLNCHLMARILQEAQASRRAGMFCSVYNRQFVR
jgi:hypothetical protein